MQAARIVTLGIVGRPQGSVAVTSGTITEAAITGGSVALADACGWLAEHRGAVNPFGQLVAAVSVGIVDGEARLDLAYAEDHRADVDANVVTRYPDQFVEIQCSGEGSMFDRAGLDRLLALARQGVTELFAAQRRALGW